MSPYYFCSSQRMLHNKFTPISELNTVRSGNMADVFGLLNTNLHDLDDSYGFVLRDSNTGHETQVFVAKEYPIPLVAAGDAVLLYNVIVTNTKCHYSKYTKTVAMSTNSEVRSAHYNDLARLNEIEFLESLMENPAGDAADSAIKDILRLLKVDSGSMAVPCTWLRFTEKTPLKYIPIVHLVNGVFEVGSRFRIYGQIVEVEPPRFYIGHTDGLKHAKCRVQIGDERGGRLVVEFRDGQETMLTGVDVAHSKDRKRRLTMVLHSLKGQFVHAGVELRRSKVLGFGVHFGA